MPKNHRLDLPPFAALRAFEMAGRFSSFTYAADVLLISQSAVSRQISSLEDHLGCSLFERERAGVRLTEIGRSYHERVSKALREISTATNDLKLQLAGLNLIRLSTLPTLAAHWLLPMLATFRSEHPRIAIDISSTNELVDFAEMEVDVAIRLGDGEWPGLCSDKLFGEHLITVCAPDYVAEVGMASIESLSKFEVINTTTRPDAWQSWLDGNGLSAIVSQANTINCQDFFISIQAAIINQGLAVVPSFLVEQELAEGRLIDPFQMPVESKRAYYFVSKTGVAQTEAVRILRKWLLRQSQAF